jgi:hypothetical protein
MQCLGTPISGLLVSLAVWSADATGGMPLCVHDRRRIAPLIICLQREALFVWMNNQ